MQKKSDFFADFTEISFLKEGTMAGITESLSAFSEKLKRFNDAGKTDRTVKPAENQQLQRQIRDREERHARVERHEISEEQIEKNGLSLQLLQLIKITKRLLKLWGSFLTGQKPWIRMSAHF